ncbi:MAG: four helix bundle protein [Bacteroidota bacterium]|nr:four helix bundle protein [Bacteroidota bacterium]
MEPLSKDFSTKDQIKRASLSIMNNVAEGYSRYSTKETIHFLDIAQSSCIEVKSMIYLLSDRNYLSNESVNLLLEQCEKTKSMILAFIKHFRTFQKSPANQIV